MGAIFPERRCCFAQKNLKEKQGNTVPEILEFSKKHNFFSSLHPLLGVVTESEQDIWIVADLLKTIYDKVPLGIRELMTQEVLTKILAFRALKDGMEILVPKQKKLVRYYVDKVLTLDKGMPAFAFVAENQTEASFLLFRGTDFSWKGRRSIASDLDLHGVGYSCFLKAQDKIAHWLKTAHQPEALGYSLGGAFAAYALLFNPDHLTRAIAFGPPGFLTKVYQEWKMLKLDDRLLVYVTKGDCISKYGNLVGNIKELSVDQKLLPITAHTLFVTAEPSYFITKV